MPKKPAYQTEPSNEMRDVVWARGTLTPLELFRIGAWKSAQGLAWMSMNTEHSIEETTRGVLTTIDRYRGVDLLDEEVDWTIWEAVARAAIGSKGEGSGLLGLSGVGYPMATAIVSWLAPTAFPVMDRWTVRAIYGDRVGRHWEGAAAYAAFTQRLCELQPLQYPDCVNVHQVDQAVMNDMMGCDEVREHCTHVAFIAIPLPR